MSSEKAPVIYIVDDDTRTGWILSKLLKNDGYTTQNFTSGFELLGLLKNGKIPDLVLSDLMMPEIIGTELIKKIHAIAPDLPVIIMTAFGTIEHAVEAMKVGAVEFVTKPINSKEIRGILKNLLKHRNGDNGKPITRKKPTSADAEKQLIGSSPAFMEAMDFARQFARTNLTVLLRGESGTGKELFALSLHEQSERKGQPFVPVDCATLPENLMESELFGHEKGAFTDAKASRAGKFEMANGGTLFLDEIGNLSIASQMKILRAIQERTIERLGSTQTQKIDVRIIAATNVNLEEAIDKGLFREDLYFRLNEVTIWLPSLRERREDIVPLARYFMQQFNDEFKTDEKHVTDISEQALDVLKRYRWRGNIRELRNVIRRAVILADGIIQGKDLPKEVVRSAERDTYQVQDDEVDVDGAVDLKEMARRETMRMERRIILRTLEANNWHLSNTAKALSVDRKTLRTKIKEYDINRSSGSGQDTD